MVAATKAALPATSQVFFQTCRSVAEPKINFASPLGGCIIFCFNALWACSRVYLWAAHEGLWRLTQTAAGDKLVKLLERILNNAKPQLQNFNLTTVGEYTEYMEKCRNQSGSQRGEKTNETMRNAARQPQSDVTRFQRSKTTIKTCKISANLKQLDNKGRKMTTKRC